eukprot:TRINITY_DN5364_c0_g1_i1.p1 TRINITY_DN5364_c0_g1~~TRINITY_DN5364_c0_g1_i1.p1  ORF type:complete len:239 (+),score=69.81 TRINITY_DN5364_c0_g1_i1:286-1002(+)
MAAATATTAALATPPPAITAAAAAATAAGSVRAWALATRSAAVAAWRGFPTVLPTPKTGGAVLPLTAAAPPRSVAARGRGRFAAELADARSAVADLAGAAVAILLVLFCGLPEDGDTPGGEPLKGGWWVTWGVPRSTPDADAAATAAAAAAATGASAGWTVDAEVDDDFHAGRSPQWRWALAVHMRVARTAVAAALAAEEAGPTRQPRMARRPSMPRICELTPLAEETQAAGVGGARR